jgi:DMSO/TMAO reductase YedYZ molybdopterin-dependent catalytic subunit
MSAPNSSGHKSQRNADGSSTSRRTFLRRAGGMTLGLALTPLMGCESNLVQTQGTGVRLPFLTPVPDFYVINGGQDAVENWPGVPDIARSSWSLSIDGLVDRPVELSFQELRDAAREVTVLKTMRCVVDTPNIPGLASTALWTGVPLRAVLDQAGIDRDTTRRLRVFARDGFNNNLRLDQVYGPQAQPGPLLAYRMNGQPLPPDHGFPVRLIAPRLYGFKNVKWVDRIEATDQVVEGGFGQYQQRLGYTDDAAIRVTSKVSDPLRQQTVPAGDLRVRGYALSGPDGVERVEVAVDDGAYREVSIRSRQSILDEVPDELRASLQRAQQWANEDTFTYPFPGVWALWEDTIQLAPGDHVIRVRATDRAGNTQPPVDDNRFDGDNAIFQVRITAE